MVETEDVQRFAEGSSQMPSSDKCQHIQCSLWLAKCVTSLERMLRSKRRRGLWTSVEDPDSDDQSAFSSLPSELLKKFFSCLPPEDAIRLSRTCHRLRRVYYRYKHDLPRRAIQTISVQYGQWRDVLKGPYGHVSDKVPIHYVLSEPTSKRKHQSVKLFRTRRRMSLQDVLENSQFETMILSVQLIHGDLSVAVPFASVRVRHLILNLGHHSLLPRRILRYLPRICDDLCTNPVVDRVDFIFAAFDQSLKDCVDSSRLSSLKKISVVFVNCVVS